MTDSSSQLSLNEWHDLILRVFGHRETDRSLAILIDLPDERLADNPDWRTRRRLAQQWQLDLGSAAQRLNLEVRLFAYRNARTNNGPLPEGAWEISPEDALPDSVDDLADGSAKPFEQIFAEHQIILAPTELSATAPLKLVAPKHGFRAATMGGFSPAMVPALRLDYTEIDRRCRRLKELLDSADSAEVEMTVEGRGEPHHLKIDLRHRSSHVSSGLLQTQGIAGNLPSGETYIVPYEGEMRGVDSHTAGSLPVQLDGELVVYEIEGNRAHRVSGDGPVADRERERLRIDPAYGNISELGLGVLAAFGIEPIGEVLLDEKLGLHIAFGRSDHFGGAVSPADFSSPDRAVHIDRVYLPQTQPQVFVHRLDLVMGDGRSRPVMRDRTYVGGLFDRQGGK